MPVYWTRPGVGIKIATDAGVSQKYYAGKKYPSIALNIAVANRMCTELAAHDKSWAETASARIFWDSLLLSAAKAVDVFESRQG